MNMQMLMQQAKKMQKDMEKAQEELKGMTFTSKQPLVEVTINGDLDVIDVKVSNEITSEDAEVLQDMILIATNDAIKQAKKVKEEKLGNVGSGLAGLF